MTKFRKTTLFIHRWLGLTSGLVVFIVSITGCIYCFQDEIQDVTHHYRKVAVQHRPYLEPSVLKQEVSRHIPGATVEGVIYTAADRPAVIYAESVKKITHVLYLDPYNGRLLHSEEYATAFFVIIEYIHLYLLLPPAIGRWVVGISVFVFIALMVTGIIMWWPKRKSDRKRCFNIKWNGRWRRVNYDLHNVLGFYAASIALILAITGLSFTFNWVRNGIYATANLGRKYPQEKLELRSDTTKAGSAKGVPVIDRVYHTAKSRSPDAQMYSIFEGEAKSGVIAVDAYATTLHYYKSDSYEFDKYTGKLLSELPHTRKSRGMKLNAMNYDLHVGQVLGLPGKIIAFSASLVCASLPVTGLIIWLGKRKKARPKRRPAIA